MWNFFGWKQSCKKRFLIAFSTMRCFICLSIYSQCVKIFLVICKEKLFLSFNAFIQILLVFMFSFVSISFYAHSFPINLLLYFLQTVADKQIDFQLFLLLFSFFRFLFLLFYHWIKFYLFPINYRDWSLNCN